LLLLFVLLWGVEVVDVVLKSLTPVRLDAWGIQPLRLSGLVGIVVAPILHVDFNHVAANTVPLLVLASMVMLEGERRFWRATALIALVNGLAVWCFGRWESVYIGASGLIFGYVGFIFMRAWVTRRPLWILLGVGCAVAFGGLVLSLLSMPEGISWLGHLSGMIAGMLAAEWLHKEERSGFVNSLKKMR
jgi:membrane associated rhomboid family serine protease